MLRTHSPTWDTGIFAILFPALLLLPVLHLHPAYEHAHGRERAHTHSPVIHADFLPGSEQAHGNHDSGHHHRPGDSSAHTLSQIPFSTLLPRSAVASLSVLEWVVLALPTEIPVLPSPVSFHAGFFLRDHAPPVQNLAFPLASPRSPPHVA